MAIAMSDRIEKGATDGVIPASCLTNVGCSLTASADAVAERGFRMDDLCLRNLIRPASEPDRHYNIINKTDNRSVLSVGTIGNCMEPFLESMEQLERAKRCVLNKVSDGYREAFEIFNRPEFVNTAVAQYYLGMIYYHGLGKPKNPEKAFDCMSLAYQGDNLNAAYYLGMMYLNGFGVKRTPFMAMKYLKESANKVNDSRA